MKRNQSFSLYRLGMLFKQDYLENYRQMFLTTGFAVVFISVINIFIAIDNNGLRSFDGFNRTCLHFEAGWLIATFIIFGIIAGSSLFTTLKTPASRLSTLMVPASQPEKFIERWLLVVPGYIIAFAFAAFIADSIRVGFCEWFLHRDTVFITLTDIFGATPITREEYGYGILLFLFLQSFFVLGSVVWQKLATVKTFWVLAAIVAIYVATGPWIAKNFYHPGYSYEAPAILDNDNAMYAILGAITLFNYALAYLRFKESEIINRW